MTEKRDISTPTCISICLTGNYILMKDLAGKPHIFPKSDFVEIGKEIIAMASDDDLPQSDVGKITLGDEKSEVQSIPQGFELDLDNLDPDNIKKQLLKGVVGMFSGATQYPRGKPTIKKK